MAVRPEEVAAIIRRQIEGFESEVVSADVGTVVEAGDGIARVFGLAGALSGELLEFHPKGGGAAVMGMALNLEEEIVGAVIMGDYRVIEEGNEVRSTGRVAEVPVGEQLIGRVVNALGEPIDGKGPLNATETRAVERIAPNVVTPRLGRHPGADRHSRDRFTDSDRPRPARTDHRRPPDWQELDRDRHDHQPEGSGSGLYLRGDRPEAGQGQPGRDHTRRARRDGPHDHRQRRFRRVRRAAVSRALLRRRDGRVLHGARPGRADHLRRPQQARGGPIARFRCCCAARPVARPTPGDVFYLHSRLLERSAKLNEDFGGGSITALPIIETQAGDVSAYIPTNVISITDGQIFLEADLFNAGQRPAVNAGVSVSRVGGSAQRRAMRSVAGQLRIDMAQFRELQAFAQFGTSDLDTATRRQLERGQRLSALLVQPENEPLPLADQVAMLYAANSGALDDVPVNKVGDFARGARDFLGTSHPDLLEGITSSGELSGDTETALSAALQTFKDSVPF